MKKEERDDNLNDAEEAKNALRELADITLDKYVEDAKVKRYKSKICKENKNNKKA